MLAANKLHNALPHPFAKETDVDCLPPHKGPSNSATYDSIHVERWCSQPGFIDPFEVVHNCVQLLRRATYVNVKYSRRMHVEGEETRPDKSQLAPGISLYFHPLQSSDEIIELVKHYISSPTQDTLRSISKTQNSTMSALIFLLTYLRLRGPLVKFRYKNLTHLSELRSTQRWLSRGFLNTICEHQLEFEAIVQLGHYLNYVVTVAFAHDLFWMKELLADLFGPVVIDFVHIGCNADETLTERELVRRRSDVMLRLIDGTPWDSLRRQQNFHLVLKSDPELDVYRRRSQFDFELNRKLTIPPHEQGVMVNNPYDVILFLNRNLNKSYSYADAAASDDDHHDHDHSNNNNYNNSNSDNNNKD